MTGLYALKLFNYGLVLLFGAFLSVFIAGGWENRRQRNLLVALCPVFFLLQILCGWLLSAEMVEKLYPLMVHLPLALSLIFALKKPVSIAIVSILTAYLCCQIPNWGDLAVTALTHSAWAGEIVYTVIIVPLFFALLRWFVEPAHSAMTYSRRSALLFGSVPAVYYVLDYATTIYTNLLYAGMPALNEMIPTVLVVFYVVFLVAYHQEAQKRTKAELQSSTQTVLLKQAQKEMEALRQAQTQIAIHRHDMRHHLNMIDAFLDAGQTEQALAYIRETKESITSICVKRFCENEPVNLICSFFAEKAASLGVRLTVNAQLPQVLPVSDTELCAILSNGLENALNSVMDMEISGKWIDLYCGVKLNKLLMEIKNPYAGQIEMEDGLPVSTNPGHGYGCRSIRAIAQQNRGLYTFEPNDGIFTLQVALPLPWTQTK